MIIDKLVVKTGTICSLRCEKCGEFNPYLAQKGKNFSLDAKTLSVDVGRISQCVHRIRCVHVAGGEALLHHDFFLFLSFLSALDNVDRIEVVTNGTVTPDAVTLKILYLFKSKVTVLISDYSASGIDNHCAVKALQDAAVSFRVMRDMVWKDKQDTSYKPLSDEELLYIAKNCTAFRKTPYFSLINGIVTAHCPTAGSLLHYLDLYEECADTFFNLRSIQDDEVLNGLKKIHEADVTPMCRYCVPSYAAMDCPAGKQLE